MKKDSRLTLRIPSETKAELEAAAQRQRRSLNWLCQDILESWVAKRRPKPKA